MAKAWKHLEKRNTRTGEVDILPVDAAGSASFIRTACEAMDLTFSQAMRVLTMGGELVADGVGCRLSK